MLLSMFNNKLKIPKELLEKVEKIVEYQTKQLKREINKELNK